MNKIRDLYQKLLRAYGPQGWWPLLNHKGSNPTKTGSVTGYHSGDYSFPKSQTQQFEICIGAILTQNTAWTNVEKALLNLQKANALDPKKLLGINEDELKEAIKPSGYFNQKARKLREFTEFFLSLQGKTPTRNQLLEVWGVGPETADSILLYAYKVPTFVVDAYTKRIFTHLKLCTEKSAYEEMKQVVEKNIKKDWKIYQEFHALLVEHAKRCYSKKPYEDTLMHQA